MQVAGLVLLGFFICFAALWWNGFIFFGKFCQKHRDMRSRILLIGEN